MFAIFYKETIWDGWFWHLKNLDLLKVQFDQYDSNRLKSPTSFGMIQILTLRKMLLLFFPHQGPGGCLGRLHLRSFISRGGCLGDGWVEVRGGHEVYAKKGDLGTRRKLLGICCDTLWATKKYSKKPGVFFTRVVTPFWPFIGFFFLHV